VIVPTRNRAHSLRRTLEALGRQTWVPDGFEVIVVANDCSDDTPPMVRALKTPYRLRLVETPTAGLSGARNAGAAAVHTDLLIFLDDDIEALPGCVAAHAHAHQGHSDLVAVGSLLPPPLPSPPDLFVERLRQLDIGFAASLANATALDWSCMIGGNFSVQQALFAAVGGFDASLGAYGGEDYEFGYRAQGAGAGFVFLPDAAGYHHRHENTTLTRYLHNARAIGSSDVGIVRRHPQMAERLHLRLATRPHTALGRLGRNLAFTRPRLGDALADVLRRTSRPLATWRWRRSWNRIMDCLYEYWYYRGVADAVGSEATMFAYLAEAARQTVSAPGGPGVGSGASPVP